MNDKLKIIGLSGTNGSGKDTVGHFMAERHGYLFVSVTELLRNDAKRRGLAVNRENLRKISAEWRRESGLGVLVDKAVAEYRKEANKYRGVVMASLRNPGEADRIHELNGTMIWVDADPRIRYDRVQTNAEVRGRAGEDKKTFEEFLAEQEAEMHQSGDEATLNIAGVKERSDIFINNNGSDVTLFEKNVEKSLGL